MLKVIVADDEPIIAQAVAVMLKEIDAQLEIVGLCYNGTKAMELIDAVEPEIAVLDIRMPGMTGLDILHKISDRHFPTRVIILSAFRDFEYAQEALRFGAEDFLVKPLDIAKLTLAIKRTKERCLDDEQRRPTIEQELFKKLTAVHAVRQQMLVDWVLDEHGAASRYRIYYIQFTKNMDDFSLKGFISGLHALPDKSTALWVNKKRLSVIALVGNRSNFALCMEIGNLVSNLGGNPAYIGFSNPHYKQDFEKACSEAEAAVQQYYYEPGTPFFEYDNSMDDSSQLVPLCMVRSLQAEHFCEKLQLGLEDAAQTLIGNIFAEINASRPLPKSIFRELQEFLRVLRQYFQDDNDLLRPVEEQIQKLLDDDLIVAHVYINDTITELIRSIARRRVEKAQLDNERIVRRVKAYCEQHYCEDLALDVVAEQIHLAKSYFCTLFRKSTGMTFGEYLTKTRIDHAKELLSYTEIKVNRIAEAVGYRNASHFNRVFSNTVGLTPMEYRRRFAAIVNQSEVKNE